MNYFYAHDVCTWSLWVNNIILSKANKKKESKAGSASGSKSAESSPSSLKKEQSATAAGKKVCHYVIIDSLAPCQFVHASVI